MNWIFQLGFVVLISISVGAQSDKEHGSSGELHGHGMRGMWMHRRSYPPMLDSLLPQETKDKIKEITANRQLNWEERREQIDQLLDSIPPSQLAKMPLPSGFEKLPIGVYEQIKEIHDDETMKWSKRRQKVRQIMHTIPHEQRRAVFKDMWFPPMPPASFESVLAPTVYQQLLKVHQNVNLTVAEKKDRVDRIMQQVPGDQLMKLPLPPLMRQLPTETQQRIRLIMHNYRTPWDERHQKVREFVQSLPKEEKRLMRPPLPEFVKDLPANVRANLEAIHNNDDLEPRDRIHQFRDIIESLPKDVRSKIPHP
jgi:hypothetical protein